MTKKEFKKFKKKFLKLWREVVFEQMQIFVSKLESIEKRKLKKLDT